MVIENHRIKLSGPLTSTWKRNGSILYTKQAHSASMRNLKNHGPFQILESCHAYFRGQKILLGKFLKNPGKPWKNPGLVLPSPGLTFFNIVTNIDVDAGHLGSYWRSKMDIYKYFGQYLQQLLPSYRACPISK